MSDHYHAYSDKPDISAGTCILVTGGSERVAVRTADQLTIESPADQRLSAVVVDRTGERLLLSTGEGRLIWLERAEGAIAFDDFQISEGFSRELWRVVRSEEPGL